MRLIERLTTRTEEQRYTLTDYLQWVSYSFQGNTYYPQTTYGTQGGEGVDGSYQGLVQGAYKANGIVWACILARLLVFSEARFQYQRFQSGRPSSLFGDATLEILEHPWPNGTTGELLARMEQDASCAGNSYWTERNGVLKRLRPDWVTILHRSPNDPANDLADDLDARLYGYAYTPGGLGSGRDPVFLYPEAVAHYSPIPDPLAVWKGMSWLTPILREIDADDLMTEHKARFFRNGATPNLVVKMDPAVTPEKVEQFAEIMDANSVGVANAYKTLYLGGGADVSIVGSSFEQMAFRATQGAGETRIAAAAGVPPIIAGFSEGLESATYSNYGQARRRFADGTLRPLWRSAAASLEHLVSTPAGARLWYDDRDIAFLRDDHQDEANTRQADTQAIKALVEAGYDPNEVIRAVTSGDLASLTGKHTGLTSVQLQPPGISAPATTE